MICGHNGYNEIVLQVPVTKLKGLFEQKAQSLEEDATNIVKAKPEDLNLFRLASDPIDPEMDAIFNEGVAKELRNEAACWKLAAMCLPKDGTMPITLGSLLSIGSTPSRGRLITPRLSMQPMPSGPFKD